MLVEIPFPQIDPAAFTLPIPHISLGPIELGPFPIRWYALGYIAGVVLGWFYCNKIVQKDRLWSDGGASPIKKDDIDDFAFWVMLGILLGGRLGYVLFYTLPYEPERVLNDPAFILRMWEGGMAFHGGLIGAGLAAVYTAWSRKIPILRLADVACAAAPMGIFIVRIANFINGELYGRATNVPWAMKFPTYSWSSREWVYSGNEQLVHPSQLYEAGLEGLLLFSIIAVAVWRFRALHWPGLVSGIFLVGYACARIFVENFREPDSFVSGLPGFLTMGMLLSTPMLIGGAWLIYRARTQAQPA